MVLFIFNETEMRNADDDAPLAANTPSTGSLTTGHVEQCGNRVLELIEQHKKEIQARMAKREVGFRGILENKDNKRPEPGRRKSESGTRASTIYNNNNSRSQREEAAYQSPRTFMDQPSRKSLTNPKPAFPKEKQQRPSTSNPKSNHRLSNNAQSSTIAQAYMDAVKESDVAVAETNFNSPPTHPTSFTSNRESSSQNQLSNVTSDEYFELPQLHSSPSHRHSMGFEGGNESDIVQVPVTPTRARPSGNTVRFSNSPHKEVEERKVSPLTPLMTTSNGKPKPLPTRQPEQIVLKSQQSPQIRVSNERIYETEEEESDGDFWNCGCIGDLVGSLNNNNNKSTASFDSADRIPSHIANDILQESRLGPVQALLSRTPSKSSPFNNNNKEGLCDVPNQMEYSSSSDDEDDPFNPGARTRGRFAAFFLWIWESFILLWIRLWMFLRDNSWGIEVLALIAVLIGGIFVVTMDLWKNPRWLRQESKQNQYYVGPIM